MPALVLFLIPLLLYLICCGLSQVEIKRCAAHFLSHPTCPLDLLTCHSQVHLVAFRPPNHPHFNLCQPLCSRFRASERGAFCVRALDVMQGKWRIVLLRWPAGCSKGEQDDYVKMAAWKRCQLAVC